MDWDLDLNTLDSTTTLDRLITITYLGHKIPPTSNVQLAYNSMMSKTAVKKKQLPFQFDVAATSFGGLGPQAQAYIYIITFLPIDVPRQLWAYIV